MIKFSEQLRFINHHRLSAPVDLVAVAGCIGLRVNYAYLAKGISGMLERVRKVIPYSYKVIINADDSHTRQRFTLAHEIGHYMLHRHLIGMGLDDDHQYRSTEGGHYHNTNIGPREETQANKFAVDLIMPKALIDTYKNKGCDVDEMAEIFQVSKKAMSIRVGEDYYPQEKTDNLNVA